MLEITSEPALELCVAAMVGFGLDLRSFAEPLNRSVRQVMVPSLRTNFDVGGRPSWDPDTAQTLNHKNGISEILVRTGALRSKAGQIGVWKVDGGAGTAALAPDSFPDYAGIHQDGWRFGPARPWAVIQDEDQDAIETIFVRWLEERMILRGLL